MGCVQAKGLPDDAEAQISHVGSVKDDEQAAPASEHEPVRTLTAKEKLEIMGVLQASEALRDVPQTELEKVAPLLDRVEFATNEIVAMEGEFGDRMYIFADGNAVMTAKDERKFHVELKRLVRGDIYSESSLFRDYLQATTVSTLSPCVLYTLKRNRIEEVQREAPQLHKMLERVAKEREMLSSTLDAMPVFKSMSKQKRYVLGDLCIMRRYKPKAKVLEQGMGSSKKFFIITRGTMDVFVGATKVRTLGPKDYFGDVAVISNQPHSASVVVTDRESAIVLELTREDFLKLLEGESGVLADFSLRVLGSRATLNEVIQHQVGRECLSKYAAKEYAKENIDFWLATTDLEAVQQSIIRKSVLRSLSVDPDLVRDKKKELLRTRAREIFQRFLAADAPEQINLHGAVSKRLTEAIEADRYTFDMFKEAREEVFSLLKDDSFSRFKESEEFEGLLKRVGAYEMS